MKTNRFLSILLIISLTVSLAVFATADNPASLQLGDTTGDGKIDAADALEVLQYSVGKRDSFSAETASSGDSQSSILAVHVYNTVADFHEWLVNQPAAPEDYVFSNDTMYDYILPNRQEMWLERYYLVPNVPEDYVLKGIYVTSLTGYRLDYFNAQGETVSYSVRTEINCDISDFESLFGYVHECQGKKYYIDFNNEKAACYYADTTYYVTTHLDMSDYDFSDFDNALAEIVSTIESTFTRVELPPLAE